MKVYANPKEISLKQIYVRKLSFVKVKLLDYLFNDVKKATKFLQALNITTGRLIATLHSVT